MNFNTLTLTLQNFIAAFSGGYSRLQGPIHGLLGIFTTLELTLFGLWAALGHGDNPASALKKVLHIGAWIWIAESYPTLLKALVTSLEQAGLMAGGGVGDASLLLDPSRIAGYGLDATKPLIDKVHSLGSFDIAEVEIFGLAYLAIMACFLLMAIQVFLAVLEYYLFAAVVGVLLPFGLFAPTKFLAEKAIGAVVSAGIKLMVLAFVLSVFDPVLQAIHFQGADITLNELFSVVLTVSALGFFCWKAPGLAASLLAGSPHLGAAEIVHTARMGIQAGLQGAAGRRAQASGGPELSDSALQAAASLYPRGEASPGGGGPSPGGLANRGKEQGGSSGRPGASASLVQSAMGNPGGGGAGGSSSPGSPSAPSSAPSSPASGIRSQPGAPSGAAGGAPNGGATAARTNPKTPAPASGTRSVAEGTLARTPAASDIARAAALSGPSDKPGAPATSPQKEPS